MSELVEVLAANWRTDGRREWASVSTWLQPGESIVVLRAAETRMTVVTTDDPRLTQTAPTGGITPVKRVPPRLFPETDV